MTNWLETLDTASESFNLQNKYINKINSQKLKTIIFYGKGHPKTFSPRIKSVKSLGVRSESKTDEDSFSIAASLVCACH